MDGTTETLIPLTSLVLEMTYWAQRAPGDQTGATSTHTGILHPYQRCAHERGSC